MAASSGRGYYAVLTVPKGRNWSVAAQGQNADTVVGALWSLLDVTAAALAKHRRRVFRSPSSLTTVAGGLIDEVHLRGKIEEPSEWGKGWVPLAGLIFIGFMGLIGQMSGRRR